MIEQILRFSKGKHLPRDEENIIMEDGLDGQPFLEGGYEAPILQLEIDRLRREKREREAKKQAKHALQVLGGVADAVRARCMRGAGTGVVP